MKLIARLDSPHGPLKIGPSEKGGSLPESMDNFTHIPIRDAHKFLPDIAAMYESNTLTTEDKLIGVAYFEDRTIYCAKRSRHDPLLDAIRTIPFIIEVIRATTEVLINTLPAASVRKIGSKVYYGVSYGDIKIEYLFADQ